MTSSRLDRLFVLLETGSSSITRSAAAKQLGEVQRLYPFELNTLLFRTAAFLRSTNWDTRIAAGEAIRAIISNLPQWNPIIIKLENNDDGNATPTTRLLSGIGRLTFKHFDISKVLDNTTYLMASEGKEFDVEEDQLIMGADLRERLAKQRQLLNIRLGLDVAAKIGFDSTSLFTNDDLMKNDPTESTNTKKPIHEIIVAATEGLSSREINRAKRKARQAINKQRQRDIAEDNCNADEPEMKKIKAESKEEVTVPQLDDELLEANHEWPLEWFCEQLSSDLFSASWETRHGAATALREIITLHGNGAGKLNYLTAEQMVSHHQAWLEDMTIRLLCVLALDRFGDFVSDSVVAPVRETCAQVLCVLLKHMNAYACNSTFNVLLQMMQHSDWEARHGGLLGLKYLLVIKLDMINEFLPKAFPQILHCLSDEVDDVSAVAAAALIPIAPKLTELVLGSVPQVIDKLWNLLSEQDELTAACNSFMGLLAAILDLPHTKSLLASLPLDTLIPKLWPFLSHSTSSVRKATLQTLYTLTTKISNDDAGSDDITPITCWGTQLLQDAMRHIFQRVLVEPHNEIRNVAEKVWRNLVKNSDLQKLLLAACPFVTAWLCLSMQPMKVPFDSNFFLQTNIPKKTGTTSNNTNPLNNYDNMVEQPKYYLGGSETTPALIREANATKVRYMATRMLGLLSCEIVKPAPGVDYTEGIEMPISCYEKVLLVYLNSKSALQRQVTGLVIAEWARLNVVDIKECPTELKRTLWHCQEEILYFDEIAHSFTRLAQETRDFLATLRHYKIPIDMNNVDVLTLPLIEQLTGPTTESALINFKLRPKLLESLQERCKSIQSSAQQTSISHKALTISTKAALSGALVMFKALPEKLNPVIKPLMDSIKYESEELLQQISANYLAILLELCRIRNPCPNDKILTNLCTFLRCDSEFTPKIFRPENDQEQTDDNYNGIITLINQQRIAECAIFKRSNSTGRGPGRPSSVANAITCVVNEQHRDNGDMESAQKLHKIQRRGACLALAEITRYFGEELPVKMPKLWDLIIGQLVKTIEDPTRYVPLSQNDEMAEQLVWDLQVLEVTTPDIHINLLNDLMHLTLPRLCLLLSHPYRAVRHLAARCLAAFAKLNSVKVMEFVVSQVLPKLDASDSDIDRQGAAEAIACIVDKLQFDIVPYVVLLVVPLLGRMSDQNKSVRLIGTHSFATLVQLMPLDGGGLADPPALRDSTLNEKKEKEREFLQQLLQPTSIPNYVVPMPIDVELRNYQQSGINWLAFLNRYKLHGILCDDMGLGKTLQSICILAGDHFYREKKYAETKSPDCAPLPSLVVCPPTLTGHWVYEVEKFINSKYLRPLQYNGNPLEREKLRKQFRKHNLIIASYDIIRKDNQFLSKMKWNYIILDEGHVIKNGKTRTSLAIKNLIGNHRLILSGTPIQNNVLELWSLFDFLMPGFLGTEKQFTAKYSRPILNSRDPKCSPKDQEAGVLAMEALHRQVLPFLLRRMKEDVLDDLPPKITQDYYCELSPLQEKLYEDFSKSQIHQTLRDSISACDDTTTASSIQGNTHIFQALRYLQNVCNHPKLVLNPTHPQYSTIMTGQFKEQPAELNNIEHSAKLPALKQLLNDCGIGGATSMCESVDFAINQHRALVFCQLKAMLDIIENDLFKEHMPNMTYLRLDGSIPPAMRHSVVTRFNNDPSIDVLLLTTQVGGLGLNLTGADTVIFVEHDWNPMKDLQAMDRAHRIGQKKVVNVYRLITRNTLEEKIMGLQKFKVQTANTVISGENSHLETMGTGHLLDLFSNKPSSGGNRTVADGKYNESGHSIKAILESLPELWDQQQYDDEYDLSQFISKLQ